MTAKGQGKAGKDSGRSPSPPPDEAAAAGGPKHRDTPTAPLFLTMFPTPGEDRKAKAVLCAAKAVKLQRKGGVLPAKAADTGGGSAAEQAVWLPVGTEADRTRETAGRREDRTKTARWVAAITCIPRWPTTSVDPRADNKC